MARSIGPQTDNGVARVLGRTALRNWFHAHCEIGQTVDVFFLDPSTISIGLPNERVKSSVEREAVITAGNLRNSHIYIDCIRDLIPDECLGASERSASQANLIRLDVEGLPQPIYTDVPCEKSGKPRKFFRERSWVSAFFAKHQVREGDCVLIHQAGERRFRISIRRDEADVDCRVSASRLSEDEQFTSPPVGSELCVEVADLTGYIARLSQIQHLPERNHEDLVKMLLLQLGHREDCIVFQQGRIDICVTNETGQVGLVIEVKRSLQSNADRRKAMRQAFDYAGQTGAARFVVTDADRFILFDRSTGALNYQDMQVGDFRISRLSLDDVEFLDFLRPNQGHG